MKRRNIVKPYRVGALVLICLICLGRPAQGSAQSSTEGSARPAGAGSTLVHSKFGGQIFGFDVDQNGTEGVLSESQLLSNGNVLAAVETFDQKTGQILNVVSKTETQDDFLTLGIAGTSVGLIEREHVTGGFVTKRIYEELNPLSTNKFTGMWTPPLKADEIILGVSRNQGIPTTVILYFINNAQDFDTFVFGSNVGENTFQPPVDLTDPTFMESNLPVVAYDSVTNEAVVASSDSAVGGPPPQIALVDLTTGVVNQFTGIPGPPPFRQGSINGLAVDSEDGIACTTTEVDFRVEFYNLKNQTGFAVVLPKASGQLQSGSDVEYDPIHKLFFVAQSVSSTGNGSSIQVYNTQGKLVESLNGFNFSNASNVIGTHIALNPSNRSGYVDGPASNVTDIQSFTY
ncbi:MAG TPA: hypothetical protein VK722_23210 [Candidatus Aquilonibacter sp.]|jgi:hypothetical protein|nr:hypothetical protein [Candidatus Aquilonibacter sp.]